MTRLFRDSSHRNQTLILIILLMICCENPLPHSEQILSIKLHPPTMSLRGELRSLMLVLTGLFFIIHEQMHIFCSVTQKENSSYMRFCGVIMSGQRRHSRASQMFFIIIILFQYI